MLTAKALMVPSMGVEVTSEGRRWAGRRVVVVGQREREERKREKGKREEGREKRKMKTNFKIIFEPFIVDRKSVV